MAEKDITLEVAAFLDSDEVLALGESREDVRRVAEYYLGACYDQIGKAPQLCDGGDVHTIVGHLLPAHFGRSDPLAPKVPAILAAYLAYLEGAKVTPQAFEMRQALEETTGEFLHAVRTGEAVHHHPPKQDPFVHGATKLGRNDPCSCGSGKKYKKCHGKKG